MKFAMVFCGIGMMITGCLLGYVFIVVVPGIQPLQSVLSGVIFGLGFAVITSALSK